MIIEYKTVDALRELSKYLLAHPELAFKEYLAHDACIDFLKMHCNDWKITPKAYGLDTAWEAVYTQGKGGHRFVFCSEYAALPDVGHACMFPPKMALNWVRRSQFDLRGWNCGSSRCSGKVERTPQFIRRSRTSRNPGRRRFRLHQSWYLCLLMLILGGGGKYFLLEGGAFKHATASLMLHPGTDNVALFSSAAIATCVVTYRGKPAHAAASPWEGANTLDALVLAHSAIGLLRQQLRPSDRVHGNITNGGRAVNIIPEYCTAMYGVRSPDPMRVKELMGKVEQCFRGAALATGTEVIVNWTRTLDMGSGNKIAGLNVHSNAKMAQRLQDYLSKDISNWASDAGILGNASTVSSLQTRADFRISAV
jgi:metal-dependent amidase/aminoacylase/carboxypeptidase family protein